MIIVRGYSLSIIVFSAVLLHLSWAGILLFDESATNATALNALHRYISLPKLPPIIAGAALCAVAAMLWPSRWTLALLVPQQILLMMSAAGCAEAIWLSQFADGVVRARGFIAADQIYSIIVAIGHTLAIIAHAVRQTR